MAVYIDTSFLLAIAQGESGAAGYLALWEDDPERFSSRLLWAECAISLKRGNAEVVQHEAARKLLSGVSALELTKKIVDMLEAEPKFSQCRTLDAIHLATALELSHHADRIVVLTLDRRMRTAAAGLSLQVAPSEPEE